jgi:hypothetical protein
MTLSDIRQFLLQMIIKCSRAVVLFSNAVETYLQSALRLPPVYKGHNRYVGIEARRSILRASIRMFRVHVQNFTTILNKTVPRGRTDALHFYFLSCRSFKPTHGIGCRAIFMFQCAQGRQINCAPLPKFLDQYTYKFSFEKPKVNAVCRVAVVIIYWSHLYVIKQLQVQCNVMFSVTKRFAKVCLLQILRPLRLWRPKAMALLA